MIKDFWKKLLLLISCCAFLTYGLIQACAYSDYDEIDSTIITPEVFVDSTELPFLLTNFQPFYTGYDNAHSFRFDDENIKDWVNYFNGKVPYNELQDFLVTMSLGTLDSIEKYPISKLNKRLHNYTILKIISTPKAKDFMQFLKIAKQNEFYATDTTTRWYFYDDKPPLPKLDKSQYQVLQEMSLIFDKSKDIFIKQRYFFQIVRAYYFNKDYQEAISFYNKYNSLFNQNILQMRAWGYVAGAYYKLKNYSQANYIYSKLYDFHPIFKTVAKYSFHPQNEDDWQQTLQLSQSTKEKETLWQLVGLYFDEQRAIEEVYKLNPHSDKLDLLLARLLNIQEMKMTSGDEDFVKVPLSYDSLNTNAYRLVKKIADNGDTRKPYLWNIAAGYFCFLSKNYKDANVYYSIAKKTLPNDSTSQSQWRILTMLNHVASMTTINIEDEAALANDLTWLKTEQKPANLRTHYPYIWMREALANKYKLQNEFIKSELLYHQDSFYSKQNNIVALKQFFIQKKYSPIESFAINDYRFNLYDIYEYLAIQATHNDNIDSAIFYMAQAKDRNVVNLLTNPFNGRIKDCNDCDHAQPQQHIYNKLSFLLKLRELKNNISKNIDIYNNALLLGNAFYNISFYGNARVFYESEFVFANTPFDLPFYCKQQLLSMDKAKLYYTKALNAAHTPEQKAKLTYLLLKVERNDFYKINVFNNPKWQSWMLPYDSIPKISFDKLNSYKNTQFYKQVIEECGYFKSYLNK